MPLRKLNLPQDLEELATVAADSFQYPENPDWGVQEDERESLIDSLQNLQNAWWVIQLGQTFIPAIREVLPGLVWEEDGKIVSLVMFQKRGASQNWVIPTVATLPEYRRRGLARKLVAASLEEIAEKGGETVVLDVIDTNYPAYTLYQNLGFEHYAGDTDLVYKPDSPYPAPEWPAELALETSSLFDWRPRYELTKRVAPQSIQTYEPTTPALFKQPGYMRLFYPIIVRAQNVKSGVFLIRLKENNQIIGYTFSDARTNQMGRHTLSIRLDPAYQQYADVILAHALHHLTTIDPDLHIEMSAASWQQHMMDAALDAGFTKRVSYLRMGIKL